MLVCPQVLAQALFSRYTFPTSNPTTPLLLLSTHQWLSNMVSKLDLSPDFQIPISKWLTILLLDTYKHLKDQLVPFLWIYNFVPIFSSSVTNPTHLTQPTPRLQVSLMLQLTLPSLHSLRPTSDQILLMFLSPSQTCSLLSQSLTTLVQANVSYRSYYKSLVSSSLDKMPFPPSLKTALRMKQIWSHSSTGNSSMTSNCPQDKTQIP